MMSLPEHDPPGEKLDGGFTLVEVLVSLALLALITALLTVMVAGARHALKYVDRTHSRAPVHAVQNYLRQAISQTQTATPQATGDQSRLGLEGEVDHIAFTTSYAPYGAVRGLYRISLSPEPNNNGVFDLIAAQELYRSGSNPDDTIPRQRAMLLSNIAGVSFSYYHARVEEGQTHWQDSWTQAGGAPSFVSMKIRFPLGDVRTWPVLTVPIGAAASSAAICPPRVNCN